MQDNVFSSNFTLQNHWVTGDPWTLIGYFTWDINGKESELLSDNLGKVYCPIQHKIRKWYKQARK